MSCVLRLRFNAVVQCSRLRQHWASMDPPGTGLDRSRGTIRVQRHSISALWAPLCALCCAVGCCWLRPWLAVD